MSLSYRDATESDFPAVVALLADDGVGAKREDAKTPLAATYYEAFKAIQRRPTNVWSLPWTETISSAQCRFF